MGETVTDGEIINVPVRTVIGKTGGKLTPFHSGNAADMARRRWDKYRREAAAAVVAEAKSSLPSVTSPGHAWGALNARLFSQIMDSDKPRGDDVEALGRNIGAIPRAHEIREAAQPTVTNNIVVGDDAARIIAEALARARGSE